jgi:hypothetical protein
MIEFFLTLSSILVILKQYFEGWTLSEGRDGVQSPKRCFNNYKMMNNVQTVSHCKYSVQLVLNIIL